MAESKQTRQLDTDKPKYFYSQDKSNRQCVMHALNNLLQRDDNNMITCKNFKTIVEELKMKYPYPFRKIIASFLYTPTSPDECGCDEESWSFSVALKYLDDNNLKYELCNLDHYQDGKAFQKGRFLLYVKLIKHENSNHAICILHGWLLDSLNKDGAEKILPGTFEKKYGEQYHIEKMWMLLG
jgi:hypothetical protein